MGDVGYVARSPKLIGAIWRGDHFVGKRMIHARSFCTEVSYSADQRSSGHRGDLVAGLESGLSSLSSFLDSNEALLHMVVPKSLFWRLTALSESHERLS